MPSNQTESLLSPFTSSAQPSLLIHRDFRQEIGHYRTGDDHPTGSDSRENLINQGRPSY
jgi:hypothetical protein